MPERPVIRRRPQQQEDGRRSRQWRSNPKQWSTPAPPSFDDLDFMRDGRSGERFDD